MTAVLPADIEPFVPHRGRMRLVDRLLHADADGVRVGLTVRAIPPLGRDGIVPAWVGVEYMAQAVSAWAGWQAAQRNEPPKLGFLLGTRRYVAHRPAFDDGAALEVDAHCELFGDNGLGMFTCRIRAGDAVVAEAALSVFEPPDADAYLNGAVA